MKHFKTKILILYLVILGLIVSVGHGFKADTAVLSAQDGGEQPVYYRMFQPIRPWGIYSNWYTLYYHTNSTDNTQKFKIYQTYKEDITEEEKSPTSINDSSPTTKQLQTKQPDDKTDIQPTNTVTKLSYEQNRMLQLINEERTKAGINPLIFDDELTKVASVKAQDMVDNNYFEHNSPTYGSPFDMMKNFGIQYYAAGENLAGYNNVEKAHIGLMNSDGHRKNILNSNFTHIGIGICKSPKYGYVFVQMFIGK